MTARDEHRELDLYSLQCPPHIGRAIAELFDEVDQLRQRSVLAALLATRDARYRYQQSAHFHAAIDAFAQLIPAMVAGIAAETAVSDKLLRDQVRLLETAPFTVHPEVLRQLGLDPKEGA